MITTLGGDRLGSGNKNKIWLNNFNRSTHNLSTRFTSTAGCGMLIPCLVKPVMRGDVFDIKINGAARTLPTTSPMFSTFKMQTDIFFCPLRLYQGILHNNPLFIGLKMSDVKFPTIRLFSYINKWKQRAKMADNSLMKYLGLSGIGKPGTGYVGDTYARIVNAIPMLAYYDIFKNYYANKQEDNAYVLTSETQYVNEEKLHVNSIIYDDEYKTINKMNDFVRNIYGILGDYNKFTAIGEVESGYAVVISIANTNVSSMEGQIGFAFNKDGTNVFYSFNQFESDYVRIKTEEDKTISLTINSAWENDSCTNLIIVWMDETPKYEQVPIINSFALENIDKMRLNLLSHHTLGSSYLINNDYADAPYNIISALPDLHTGKTPNNNDLCGLALKTYQADLFNAWLNTEWLDGENGIAEMSKIAVQDGAIYIDAMILAEKTFKMLNRIAVAGGTYEAWQDVVYQESERKHIESPIYCGGQSYEIVFEEIVQTTPTDGAPLGTLGGRGLAVKRKGGNVSIKVDEAGFIMGIVSITPRIYYTQGNEFYMTELDSMDDLHKPNLDGIGFQNLLGERMVWEDTTINANAPMERTIVGKVPAWIEYMTDVDRAYGEFCDLNKQGAMILGRHYEVNNSGEVQDFTTYIDPSKFNYAFGNANLTAQNFWVQIDFDIKARRLMSAKQMPNL